MPTRNFSQKCDRVPVAHVNPLMWRWLVYDSGQQTFVEVTQVYQSLLTAHPGLNEPDWNKL